LPAGVDGLAEVGPDGVEVVGEAVELPAGLATGDVEPGRAGTVGQPEVGREEELIVEAKDRVGIGFEVFADFHSPVAE